MQINFEYKPYSKIIINELLKYEFDDFVHLAAGGKLHWSNGILFQVLPAPQTALTIEKQINEGIIYWSSVQFCKLGQYQEIIVDPKSNKPIRVIKGDVNNVFVGFAQWVKEQSQFWSDGV